MLYNYCNKENGGIDMKYFNRKRISWANFEAANEDKRTAFENMCRILFCDKFLDSKTISHSNPNNPGVEIEPIMDKNSGKMISFQSKYFDCLNSGCYTQIRHSAEKAIKYYGKGLDRIYLYCNKDLTTTSKSYNDIVSLLQTANIELELISNNSILDEVKKNEVVATYFFFCHGISDEWFKEQVNENLSSLGAKYNKDLDVNTPISNQIELFSLSDNAVKTINNRKAEAIKQIKDSRWRYSDYSQTINSLCELILSLPDVNTSDFSCCLEWNDIINKNLSADIFSLQTQQENNQKIIKSLDDSNDKEEIGRLEKQTHIISSLLHKISNCLLFNHLEKSLISKKTVILKGDAGVGKSHLFARKASQAIDNGNYSILMLGNTFINDEYLENQIINNLGLDFGFDELLSIIECIGEIQQKTIVIFIDAINESSYRDIWKTGLYKIINKIEKLSFVKLALSIRSGYEPFVLDDSIKEMLNNKTIVQLVHGGFSENSIDAIKQFLNFYDIPFLPSLCLNYQMTNPLFLNIFCKVYRTADIGLDFNVFDLFDKLIVNANTELTKALNADPSIIILNELINEIIQFQVDNNKNSITRTDLLRLEFWQTYGITSLKLPCLTILEKASILVSFVNDNVEYYQLSYHLLTDYLHARFIIQKFSDGNDLVNYIITNLLKIENGKITKRINEDIFIAVCSLSAEMFCQDFFEDITSTLDEPYEVDYLCEKYLESFSWRKNKTINQQSFKNFINNHNFDPNKVWGLLIENSTKPNHKLNAEFLHSLLIKYPLNYRDYIWTLCVNDMSDEDRLVQIVEYFDNGHSLAPLELESVKLLLILLSWILTSTNRYLRDKTSKAMVELLKNNFELCEYILRKFESVNDPYVSQRLFCVVFGACVKRESEHKHEYTQLVNYVYTRIFKQEKVYPDILLRDYARLIIERFLYEFPNEIDIDVSIIIPPYNSDAIPTVDKEDYYKKESLYSGFNRIYLSMLPNLPNRPAAYGDFGRYVFQSGLEKFDNVDIENLYHYAMQYIRDTLEYKDDYFKNDDPSPYGRLYSRHDDKKTERIGKKYQWIAFWNILARVSDTHLLKNYDEAPSPYTGPWNMYIRDFDPTLNQNNLISFDKPEIMVPEYANQFIVSNKDEDIEEWVNNDSELFNSFPNNILIRDNNNIEWISLHIYKKLKSKQKHYETFGSVTDMGNQWIWAIATGYLVDKDDFCDVKKELESSNLYDYRLQDANCHTEIFNREYPWAKSFVEVEGNPLIDLLVDSGETRIVKEIGIELDKEKLEEGILEYIEIPIERIEHIEKVIARYMVSYTSTVWESTYDASQSESTRIDHPCMDIVSKLHLKQKDIDGSYYSENNELVAFEHKIDDENEYLLIRKDYIEKYLSENHLVLFWTLFGEKQFFLGDNNQKWSTWGGFYYFDCDKGSIEGSSRIQTD